MRIHEVRPTAVDPGSDSPSRSSSRRPRPGPRTARSRRFPGISSRPRSSPSSPTTPSTWRRATTSESTRRASRRRRPPRAGPRTSAPSGSRSRSPNPPSNSSADSPPAPTAVRGSPSSGTRSEPHGLPASGSPRLPRLPTSKDPKARSNLGDVPNSAGRRARRAARTLYHNCTHGLYTPRAGAAPRAVRLARGRSRVATTDASD